MGLNKRMGQPGDVVAVFEAGEINGKRQRVEKCKAYFHGWGLEIEEDKDGFSSYTVAIVELEDGSIKTYNPWSIQFPESNDSPNEFSISILGN